MADIILGGKTYEGIGSVRLDQTQGGTVDFVEYDTAYEEGRLAGAEEGAKSEYDKFWDAYQMNGNLRMYAYSFCKPGWTDANFRPKYDIKPAVCNNMFWESTITDLASVISEQGLTFSTEDATNLDFVFAGSGITHVPRVDMRKATTANAAFNMAASLETIDCIVLSEENAIVRENWFSYCANLKNVVFEGVIGQNIIFEVSPLTNASITSVISHLSDSAAGNSATFMLSAVNTAFETASGAADGATSEEWLALVNTKPNWTVSLV